jgi:hypothetical protein
MQGNALATLALISIVPITIALFALLTPTRAVLVMTFFSALFLPERVGFDLPLFPHLGKTALPALCMLIGALVTARDRIGQAKPGRGLDLLMLLTVLGAVGTSLTNGDTLVYGGNRVLPGIPKAEAISGPLAALLGPLVPFFLGRTLFRKSEDAHDILRAFVIAGLVYTPLILIETRLSPQLHNWVYGFHAHSFTQTRRWGGYRPTVFMTHGLCVALLILGSAVSASALKKAGLPLFRSVSRSAAVLLSMMVPVMKSAGVLIYGILALPLILFTKARTMTRVAVVLAALSVCYPLLRSMDVFPAQYLVDAAARFSQERAASLVFRFDNEKILYQHAMERPVFGWGGWNRSHVFDEFGKDVSTADGKWVVVLGLNGLVGFLSYFGMLAIPVFHAHRNLKRVSPQQQIVLGSLALLAACYAVDMLPNSGFAEIPMFLAGAVAGLSQGMAEEGSRTRIDPRLATRLYGLLRRMQSSSPRQVGTR